MYFLFILIPSSNISLMYFNQIISFYNLKIILQIYTISTIDKLEMLSKDVCISYYFIIKTKSLYILHDYPKYNR